MGRKFPWVSSLGSDFRYDFGAAFTEEQQQNGADYNFKHVDRVAPQREGISAFVLQDGVIHHTYSTYARGVEQLMGTFGYLDVAPLGRNVQVSEGPHQLLDAARVGRVGVVDHSVLEDERAHPFALRRHLVDVREVVVGSAALLLLGERRPEVVPEVAAER